MSKRKKKILIVIGIISFIIMRIYIANNKNYVVKDIERDVNIINFESEAQLDNPPTDNNYGHENGNGVTILLSNRNEFLNSVSNLDYGLSVVNALYEGLDYINIITEYTEEDIDKYFYSNREVINILYGIKDLDTFKEFFSNLDNGKYVECKIIIKSIVENDNLFNFEIELSGDKKVILPIKALAKDSDDMIARLYLYN